MLKSFYLPDSFPAFFFNSERLKTPLGYNTAGSVVYIDFLKYPHFLISGATGQGKSTAIKTIIAALLINNFQDEIQLVLIDLKKVELNTFKTVPHCLKFCDNIDDAKRVLSDVLDVIHRRFDVLQNLNKTSNNGLFSDIFLIIDEYANLILIDKSIEKTIILISQLGRAAGVHLILCTQLPTAKIITNLINVNINCRLALRVETSLNSRAILNVKGAELLRTPGDAILKQDIDLQHFRVFQTPPDYINTLVNSWDSQL